MLAAVLVSSCGKQASPLVTVLVPQIVSTEVLPGTDAVTLFASISGSAHFTDCGFGLVKDGLIREYLAVPDQEALSFSATPDGLVSDTDYGFYAFIANGTSRIQTPERVFRTLASESPGPDKPSVSFVTVNAVPGPRSAVLSATLSETDDVDQVGFSISADGHNYSDCPVTLDAGGFSYIWEGLNPDTVYSFMAWAEQRGQRVSSEPVVFRTEAEAHSVSFTGVNATPQAFSVVLDATVDDASYVTYCGFGLSREGRTPVEYPAILSGNSFSVEATDLLPDTDYVYYAFVTVDGQRVTSDFSGFRTAEDPTIHILDIGADAAVNKVCLSARLSRVQDVTSAGFALAADGTDFTEKEAALATDGRMSLEWGGLEADTHYRFYVFACSAGGRVVSQTMEFYTQKASSGDVEILSLEAIPDGDSVTLLARLSATDGVTDCGFGLSSNGFDYVEYGATLVADSFSKVVSGLSAGITYYYYAFYSLKGEQYQSNTFSFQIPKP